jgi:ACS family tartrate transporter-like MFS transporter
MTLQSAPPNALDSARRKAYFRVLPLLFLCYVVAYVDRSNVGLAKLTMTKDLRAFDDRVIGLGAGVFFFVGYFMLEIPGTLICERWSARKWICRIMITWGIVAALTATVKTPRQFYLVRFGLGLAEAGFFPGVIVYLSHWFSRRDRARALAIFFVATPVAQIISPKISNGLLKIGTPGHIDLLGLHGWQWLYIFWGIPAVICGIAVWMFLPDHPRDAHWLDPDERRVMEDELSAERAMLGPRRRMSVVEALCHPKVLLLTLAYFGTTSANYGFEFFMPTILKDWYGLKLDAITWLVILPPALALGTQLFAGWSSDRTRERRLHTVIPTAIGGAALALVPLTHGRLMLTVACFMLLFGGIKALQPGFWSLPNLLLTESAAAGSIGFINSVGNLGGALGPYVLGDLKTRTQSFVPGIYLLCALMFISAAIILFLGLGHRERAEA